MIGLFKIMVLGRTFINCFKNWLILVMMLHHCSYPSNIKLSVIDIY